MALKFPSVNFSFQSGAKGRTNDEIIADPARFLTIPKLSFRWSPGLTPLDVRTVRKAVSSAEFCQIGVNWIFAHQEEGKVAPGG